VIRTLEARHSDPPISVEEPMPLEHPQPDLLYRRFAPLRIVARRLRTSPVPADAFFDPDDFMLMDWCRADRPGTISLFKHVDTRHYLNLDARGTAYRYVPPANARAGTGTYVRHRELRDALDDLALWELPWMRPELADHRRGVEWEDRAERFAALNGVDLGRAS
jgi:hypothetical protein